MTTSPGQPLDFSGVQLHGSDEWLYQQIAAVIEDAVTSGRIKPRTLLPSEKTIMDLTGASRWSVRHAVQYLRDRGVVYTVPHMGTFAGPPPGRS